MSAGGLTRRCGVSAQEWLPLDVDQLLALSSGTEEWFYDLDVAVDSPLGRLTFGLHDSTATYLEGPREPAERACAIFKHASVAVA